MKKLVLVGLVLALSGGSVGASVAKGRAIYSATALAHKKQFEAGLAAYNSGDFETAVGIWAPLAEQGVGSAQGNLGFMYLNGLGVLQDYVAAASWYRKAADLGEAEAQVSLGFMYEKGQGFLPQDYAAAASLYRKAADQGNASAQSNLGADYEIGQGVSQDYAAAAIWYRKAADQDDTKAQFKLGALYYSGQGVPQDFVQAHRWFNLAAAGASDSEVRKRAATNRDAVAAKMTPAQVAEAQRLASEWRKK